MKQFFILLVTLCVTSCSSILQTSLSDENTPNGDFLACLIDGNTRVFDVKKEKDIASSDVIFVVGKMQIEEDMTYSFTFVIDEVKDVYLLNITDEDVREVLFDGEQLIRHKKIINFVKRAGGIL